MKEQINTIIDARLALLEKNLKATKTIKEMGTNVELPLLQIVNELTDTLIDIKSILNSDENQE